MYARLYHILFLFFVAVSTVFGQINTPIGINLYSIVSSQTKKEKASFLEQINACKNQHLTYLSISNFVNDPTINWSASELEQIYAAIKTFKGISSLEISLKKASNLTFTQGDTTFLKLLACLPTAQTAKVYL